MKNKLNYFTSRTSMFCLGFFLLYKYSYQNAWVAVILGTMLGIIVVYIYSIIKKYTNNTLSIAFSNKPFGIFYKFIFIFFYLYLILIILIILPMFVNSFYLLNTPKIIINLSFLLLAIYVSTKNKLVLLSLSNLLFYLSLLIIFTFSLLLLKYVDVTNLMPFLNSFKQSIIITSLIYASITSIPLIINIDYYANFKSMAKDYLIASFSIFVITLMTILALGMPLITVYSFPEYAVLKQIEYLNFIENIENISSVVWYLDMFIMLSSLTVNLKNIIPKKYNKITLTILYIIILLISSLFFGNDYQKIIDLYYVHAIILGIFLLIFSSLILYFKKNTH